MAIRRSLTFATITSSVCLAAVSMALAVTSWSATRSVTLTKTVWAPPFRVHELTAPCKRRLASSSKGAVARAFAQRLSSVRETSFLAISVMRTQNACQSCAIKNLRNASLKRKDKVIKSRQISTGRSIWGLIMHTRGMRLPLLRLGRSKLRMWSSSALLEPSSCSLPFSSNAFSDREAGVMGTLGVMEVQPLCPVLWSTSHCATH